MYQLVHAELGPGQRASTTHTPHNNEYKTALVSYLSRVYIGFLQTTPLHTAHLTHLTPASSRVRRLWLSLSRPLPLPAPHRTPPAPAPVLYPLPHPLDSGVPPRVPPRRNRRLLLRPFSVARSQYPLYRYPPRLRCHYSYPPHPCCLPTMATTTPRVVPPLLCRGRARRHAGLLSPRSHRCSVQSTRPLGGGERRGEADRSWSRGAASTLPTATARVPAAAHPLAGATPPRRPRPMRRAEEAPRSSGGEAGGMGGGGGRGG